ncbi:hypothetical protein RB195_008217 [Necator americanus]|uniref:TLDc domain-containing protein n=1 Tax=Necator americanus TaxID=51031 RepID=A0ABR1CPF5_NECAM
MSFYPTIQRSREGSQRQFCYQLYMGNSEGKTKEFDKSSASSTSRRIDKRVEQAFVTLTGSASTALTFGILKGVFSEGLAESLWKYLSDSKPCDATLSIDEFSRHAPSLMGTSTDIYIKVCQPVLHLIKTCSEAAGAGAVAGDEPFIRNLVNEMSAGGSNANAIICWKNALCPKFCNALQGLVLQVFLGYNYPATDYSSDILTPLQMWYVQCSLPGKYFATENTKKTNVFDYRGPTVSIFELTDKSVYVLATEETWRHGSSRFGGSDTMLFQLAPKLDRWEASASIYCNFKIRSAGFGLSFKDVMKIDKDMSNIESIEVWGCAASNALEDQQKLRMWQNQQAEKNRKVPLPGNWDDNPDKTILEMAGFKFSDERRKMDLEAQSTR